MKHQQRQQQHHRIKWGAQYSRQTNIFRVQHVLYIVHIVRISIVVHFLCFVYNLAVCTKMTLLNVKNDVFKCRLILE